MRVGSWEFNVPKTLQHIRIASTAQGKAVFPFLLTACIRRMRIPVSVIVNQIAHGASFQEILESYPDLEQRDIQQALEYAAWLTQEEVHPLQV